jgi:hypothetical protein
VGKGFYERLRESRQDDKDLATCIEEVVAELEGVSTGSNRPGMLLGKIQSGKTRAFIGVIARAFDRGFDIAVVLTKSNKQLAQQTVARLSLDFEPLIEDDEIFVQDIMTLPLKLSKDERNRKLVLVAKKQPDNLERLLEFFEQSYPEFKKSRVLLIDDEADLASVRFYKERTSSAVVQGAISTQIDQLRQCVDKMAFLQVTATPYSLYLQPENYDASGPQTYIFLPKKPAFTKLLPIHKGYVGGDDYFGTFEPDDPRFYLFVDVARVEQNALRRAGPGQIRPDTVLTNPNLVGLRRSIISFVLAASIRRWQQKQANVKKIQKYVMIIHNDTQTQAHAWQEKIIDWIFAAIEQAADKSPTVLEDLFEIAYSDLSKSVKADGGAMPNKKTAFSLVLSVLRDEVAIAKINNKSKVLLDKKGELLLRTTCNIFVGGNILDRGLTIPNLISFYYGRNPKTMQADTVLQHSRMYGNRDRRDLAVTRLYTSKEVKDRLSNIHEFETALREAFLNGSHKQGVVFMRADRSKGVRPCDPNKILLSKVIALRPTGLFLPTSFDIHPASVVEPIMKKLLALIPESIHDKPTFVEFDKARVLKIIGLIEQTIKFDDEKFEWDAMRGLLDYYSDAHAGGDGKVLVLAATDRTIHRLHSGDKSGTSILGTSLRALSRVKNRSKPAMFFLKQFGTQKYGWSGPSFWWPVLAAPTTVEPCVFATKVATN